MTTAVEDVDRALVDLVGDASDLDGVRLAVDTLSDVLLAHLAYEQHLVGPLNTLGIGI